MPHTLCARPKQGPRDLSKGCVIIFCSSGRRARFFFVFRVARRNAPMMAANRLNLSSRAILFLFVLIGIPSAARSATLEDHAKELAREIAAALPAQENVSCEFRNISSLQPDEVAGIEQVFKAELQGLGVRLSSSSETAIQVAVTLSENFKGFVWTGEIHKGDSSQVFLIDAERSPENRSFADAMPVTIQSEKFWEGPERILDAGEVSNGAGKFWLVLLLPGGLRIQDKQTGAASTLVIGTAASTSRDPWGNLNIGPIGNTVGLFLPPHACTVNLEIGSLAECLPTGGPEAPPGGRTPVEVDITPPGPPPQGKGTQIEMGSVCGGANQFLATGAGDYTQTDSLQVFETKSSGSLAVSAELNFPGPITGLHSVSETPRVVVRNLTTGNYEAYRLSFSCGH